MNEQRMATISYALEKVPCAGDREIRMRPVPVLGQSRPHREGNHVR